ncbi:unnamed protein product [Albugo candida]|uniref:Protein kinase domain-containing protein n=1 Tax=Albugo candida TaxID=65357 RepID=A0A024GCG5_9STRA|nr:unnamed protein product [Albugo candida]|eukprot:CCI44235.1 unnamed protein product [Albugo candida]
MTHVIPNAAIDVLDKMVRVDPQAQLLSSQVAKHPFMVGGNGETIMPLEIDTTFALYRCTYRSPSTTFIKSSGKAPIYGRWQWRNNNAIRDRHDLCTLPMHLSENDNCCPFHYITFATDSVPRLLIDLFGCQKAQNQTSNSVSLVLFFPFYTFLHHAVFCIRYGTHAPDTFFVSL